MRVTNFIREYVTEKVYEKFDPAIRAVNESFRTRQDEFFERYEKLVDEFNERASAIAVEVGLADEGSDRKYVRSSHCPVHWDVVEQKKQDLFRRRDDAIRDILLSLELGETSKDMLKDAIDAISV